MLRHEDKQPRSGIVIAERRRVPIRVSLPERDEGTRLGRDVTRSPDMPDLFTDLDNPGLVVAVLHLGNHFSGHDHLSRIRREGIEPHAATISCRAVRHGPATLSSFSNTA